MPNEFAIFITASAAAFGAVVGSFLNVCIFRLPRADEGLTIGRPARSFCPSCGSSIAWYDNVPVLSWFCLHALCRRCRAPISLRYPLVETLTAVLFVVIVHRQVVQLEGSWAACAVLLALASALIAASFIDIDLRILPDEVTVGGMHLVPLVAVLVPELHARRPDGLAVDLLLALRSYLAPLGEVLPRALRQPLAAAVLAAIAAAGAFALGAWLYSVYRRVRIPQEPRGLRTVSLAGVLSASAAGLAAIVLLRPELSLAPAAYSLWAALLGMLAGSGSIFLVGVAGTTLFRKPAMGFGDVKLMGLLGGFAGWSGALAGFFVACLLGSIVGIGRLIVSRDRYLPFGPFLAAGCFALVLWPDVFAALLESYLALFRG
jgi:leader peptidase (prepilin peptidase)/N-methyltransferase